MRDPDRAILVLGVSYPHALGCSLIGSQNIGHEIFSYLHSLARSDIGLGLQDGNSARQKEAT
jgi:hypothetical protein